MTDRPFEVARCSQPELSGHTVPDMAALTLFEVAHSTPARAREFQYFLAHAGAAGWYGGVENAGEVAIAQLQN